MKDYRESIAFPVLDTRHLERLREIGTSCEFRDGEVLFAEGDRGYDFFVVEEGQVEILEHSAGSASTITIHEVGEFTGDVDMLTGRASLVTARARGATRVIRMPVAGVKKIVADEPELGNTILRGFLTRRALLLDQGFTGLRIVGSRFSRDTVRLTQFAARNGIPHTWIDVEEDTAAAEILTQLGVSVEEMPVVITGSGELLRRPTIAELANTMGLAAPARGSEMTDLLIVGAGPAGLAAAVYGASEGLRTVVLEAHHIGGQAGGSTRIENYLGFPTGISGAELTDRAQLQAQRFGAEISVPVRVAGLEVEPGRKSVLLGGEQALESVTLCDRRTDEETTEKAAGLFLFIGAVPRTEWLKGKVETDERGFLLTGSQLTAGRTGPPEAFRSPGRPPHLLETSVPGVFAVGDVRSRSVKRVASAVGEGSMSVSFVHQYLARGSRLPGLRREKQPHAESGSYNSV